MVDASYVCAVRAQIVPDALGLRAAGLDFNDGDEGHTTKQERGDLLGRPSPANFVDRADSEDSALRAAQHLPGKRAGMVEPVHKDLAVDQGVLIARGFLNIAPASGGEIVHKGRRR